MIIQKKASEADLIKLAKHFQGYIKIVVDVERKILAGGSKRHVDDEKILLADGSRQMDLWGGGLDLETKEIDYNSIINLRPNQSNPSRDILDKKIREEFNTIVRNLLLK
jgi:hypothetical protein